MALQTSDADDRERKQAGRPLRVTQLPSTLDLFEGCGTVSTSVGARRSIGSVPKPGTKRWEDPSPSLTKTQAKDLSWAQGQEQGPQASVWPCLLLFISQPAMAPDPHCCFCRVCAGENEALHTQVCSSVLLTSGNRVQGVGQGALSSLGGGAINTASRIQVTVASLSNNCDPDAREHRRVPSSSWHCLLQNGLE